MSKFIAFLFGFFLLVWIAVFLLLLLIHISRVFFNKDEILSFKEFLVLSIWWLTFLSGNSELIYEMIFQRKKRSNK